MPDQAETPVTPWPDWLEGLHPADRCGDILLAVARAEEDGPRLTAGEALALMLRLLGEAARLACTGPGGDHVYLSTSCLHGEHSYCGSAEGGNEAGQTWVKVPASCKFCGSPCVCAECGHGEAQAGQVPPARYADEWPATMLKAQLAQAVAALRRLALPDPMTAIDDDGEPRYPPAELAARREHAAGVLETIARLAGDTEPRAIRESRNGNPVTPEPVMELLEQAWKLNCDITSAAVPVPEGWLERAGSWQSRYWAVAREYRLARAGKAGPAAEPEPDPESPLPPGEYARVEIMGHGYECGWVTERTRAGVPVLVVSDWDGTVKAEIPGQSLYKFVPLPTPRKPPAAPRAITAPVHVDDDPADDPDEYAAHVPGCRRDFCDGECMDRTPF